MSNLNSSLAIEEIVESNGQTELDFLLQSRHLSTVNTVLEPKIQPIHKVVKVTGCITVSF